MKTRLKLLAFGLTLCLSAPAAAVVIYDEDIDGDFSNVPASPTGLSLSLGSNQILGTTVAGDPDIFTLSLGAGLLLDGLVIDLFSANNVAFIAVQTGNEWTAGTGGAASIDATKLLGWAHFGPMGAVGTDILPAIGMGGFGATGFTPPLGSGSYAFLVQETGGFAVDYGLDFQVSAVPVPPALLLFLTGLAGLGVTRFLPDIKARRAAT